MMRVPPGRIRLLAFASTFVLFVVAGTSCTSAPKRIVLIAHRAAHASAPENSLAAIRRAIELGCDYVELDVRETADGVLILMHDATVDDTTDGTGEVADMTFTRIRDLRFTRGSEWSAERVPTFDDALSTCEGRIKIYVDNKSGPPEKVMAAIERHGMVGDVVIYDSPERLLAFKSLKREVRVIPGHPGTDAEMNALLSGLQPELLDGNARGWTAEQVAAAHRAGVQVWVDNLGENDNEPGFERSVEMGVDGIQTDYPELLTEWLEKHGHR